MATSTELESIIQTIAERTTRSEDIDGVSRTWKLTAADDFVVYEFRSHNAVSYIHYFWNEKITFPKPVLENLVSVALSSGKGTVLTRAHRQWSDEREDTYITIGEDYYISGDEETLIFLELNLSEDDPEFTVSRVTSEG